MLSGIVYNSLVKGEIHIGRKSGDPVPEIILGAIGIQKNHAKIKLNSKGLFELHVCAEGATGTMINGESMTLKKRMRVLNHCDRISFAGGNIYLFKYPKLKRAVNALIEASDEIKEQSTLTKEDQQNLAWKMMLETGIDGVSSTDPASMSVSDYSAEEITEDNNAIDWDHAFDEVENGERNKQEKI
jgi:hypothetical protein